MATRRITRAAARALAEAQAEAQAQASSLSSLSTQSTPAESTSTATASTNTPSTGKPSTGRTPAGKQSATKPSTNDPSSDPTSSDMLPDPASTPPSGHHSSSTSSSVPQNYFGTVFLLLLFSLIIWFASKMPFVKRLMSWFTPTKVDLTPDTCQAMCATAVNVLDLTQDVVSTADYFGIPRHGATCADLLNALASEPHAGRVRESANQVESIELKKHWAIVDGLQNELCVKFGKGNNQSSPHLDTFNAAFGYVLKSDIALKNHEGKETEEPAKHSELINIRNAARETAAGRIRKACERYVKK